MPNPPLTAQEIIERLRLEPHPAEGGYFRETHRSRERHDAAKDADARSLSTAIYYLVTPESFSTLHRLPGEEVFHFYLGDPVQMLQLLADGTSRRQVLGPDLRSGQLPQVVVPAGTWQGTRLVPGGAFALLGTTMSPGFDPRDYEPGEMADLIARYPAEAEWIRALLPART